MATIDDDVNLGQVLHGLWRARLWIGLTGLAAGLVAVVVTLAMPDVYRSVAVLAPASDPTQSVPKSLAAQVSGLTGLALGGSSVDSTQATLATLKSRAFLVAFVRRHQLEVPLMAAEGWNREQQTWIVDPAIYDEASQRWVRSPQPPRGAEPSDGEIYDVLADDIEVKFDRATGLITVTLDSISPVAARDWLATMITDLNAEMRSRAIEEATSSMSYLERQVQATDVASIRSALSRIIEEQLRTRMLAEVRPSYAVTVIDPPALPELKIAPIRSVICVAAAVLGALLAALVVLTVNALSGGRGAAAR